MFEFSLKFDRQNSLFLDLCLNHTLPYIGASEGKESACSAGRVRSLGWDDPLEKGMSTQSSILA